MNNSHKKNGAVAPFFNMFKAELELVNQAYTNDVVCVLTQWVVVIQLVDFVINIGRHVFVEVVSRANVDVFVQVSIADTFDIFALLLYVCDRWTQAEIKLVLCN